MVHVGETVNFTWLYLYIQNSLNSFIWMSLVLMMFSPVSIATNGNDKEYTITFFILSIHSYHNLKKKSFIEHFYYTLEKEKFYRALLL